MNMVSVIYVGEYPGVFLPDNTLCENGAPVQLPKADADALINQGLFELTPGTTTKNEDK